MSIHVHHVTAGAAVDDQEALEQFQKQWSTYQKMVDHDSLSHRRVGLILHEALLPIPEPFDFADIACGDAGQMKRALQGTKVRRYHGIDLSEPALESGECALRCRARLSRFCRSADETAGTRWRGVVQPLHPSPRHRREAQDAVGHPRLDE